MRFTCRAADFMHALIEQRSKQPAHAACGQQVRPTCQTRYERHESLPACPSETGCAPVSSPSDFADRFGRHGACCRSPKLQAPVNDTHALSPKGIASVMDLASYLLLSAAVFAGAFVSGLAGFAFSAVAGGILLHVFLPLEAVPLMMACSIGV